MSSTQPHAHLSTTELRPNLSAAIHAAMTSPVRVRCLLEQCLKPVDEVGRGVPSRVSSEGQFKRGSRWNAGREGTPMLTVAKDQQDTPSIPKPGGSMLDEIVREGARRMLAAALEAEVAAYIGEHTDQLDQHGHRLVVRNGRHQPRQVLTSSGAIEVVAPRVNDKRVDATTGERKRFSSAILAPWCRKSPKITEVLPLLYLHGLSAASITRLTAQWQDQARAFGARDLSGVDYVYLWADGIHVNIRLEEERLCLLVLVGVRADGSKELVALADGYRESAGSWADLLRDAKRRGMRAPVLAMGDGALGFWSALGEVFPTTREHRCWFHKIANVLAALPKSAHPGAKKALAEIWNAEDGEHAGPRPTRSLTRTGRSSPRPRRRSPTTSKNCSRSTTSQPSTGSICAPPTRSSQPSPRCATGPRSPRDPAPRPPASPWPSS